MLEDLRGRIGYDYDSSGLTAAADGAKQFGKASEDMGTQADKGAAGTTRMGGAMAGMAKHKAGIVAAAAGVAVLTGAISAGVAEARKYDAAMGEVSTLLDADAMPKMAEFKAEVLGVAAATGQDAVVATRGLYNALSAGVPPDNAISFLANAGKAAVAGATDMNTAVGALTVGLNAWNLDASESGRVSDAMFMGVKLGVTTFDELGAKLGKVAGLAGSLNIGIEDTVGTLAQITTKGFKTSEAVTAMRASIVSMQKPNKALAGQLTELGYANGEAALKSLGYAESMKLIKQISDDTNTPVIELTGSAEAQAAVLAVTGDNWDSYQDKLAAVAGGAGAAETAFDKMSTTSEFKMKQFSASFQAAKIAVGDVFLPVFASILEVATPVLDGLLAMAKAVQPMADAFGRAPKPIRMVVGAISALLLGVAAVAGTVAAWSVSWGMAIGAVGGWPMVLGTVTSAVTTAGAAIAAAFLPVAAIIGTVVAVRHATSSYNEVVAKGAAIAEGAGGALESYGLAIERNTQRAGFWAKAGAVLKKDLTDVANVRPGTDAWLEFGLGLDESVRKSSGFRKAYADLVGQLNDGTITHEVYEQSLLGVANAYSVTTGFGEVYSQAQRELMDTTLGSLTALADASGVSSVFGSQIEDMAASVGKGTMSLEEAKAAVRALATEQDAALETMATEGENPLASMALSLGEGYAKMAQSSELFGLGEEDRAEKMAEVRQETNERIFTSLDELWNTRQDYDARMASLSAEGDTAGIAKLAAEYEASRDSIRESLAQTVIDHTNAMVLMGEVSAETARGVFQALSTAYPDSEVINPATEATLEFNATLNQVLEGEKDPEAIVAAIDAVEGAMIEVDARNRESLGVAQESWSGMAAASAGGADVIVGASGLQVSAMDGTSAAAAAHAEQMGTHAKVAADGVVNAAGDIEKSLTGTQKDLRDTAGEAKRAGEGMTDAIAGVPDAVTGRVNDATDALSGLARKQDEVGRASRDMGDEAGAGMGAGGQAAEDAGRAVGGASDQMVASLGMVSQASDDTAERLGELPDDVQIDLELTGADAAIDTLDQLARMIDQLRGSASNPIVIRTRHAPMDEPTSPGSPRFQLSSWVDELRRNADDGIDVRSRVSDESGAGLLSAVDGGELRWRRYLRELSSADYEVVVNARLEDDGLLAQILEAQGAAEALWAAAQGTWDTFFLGSSGDPSSLAGMLSSWATEGFAGLDWARVGEDMAIPINSFEEFLAVFNEADPDRKQELWKRFYDDLRRYENERHDERMGFLDAEEQRVTDVVDFETQRLEMMVADQAAADERSGTGPQKLKGFSGEVDRIAQLFYDMGVIMEPSKDALEQFYSDATGGARDTIGTADELLEVLGLIGEGWSDGIDEARDAEDVRHDAQMTNLEDTNRTLGRQLADWKDGLKSVQDAEKELADARKAFLKEARDEMKQALDLEKDAHKIALDRLGELKDAEQDRHDARVKGLKDERDIEDDLHDESMDALEDEADAARAPLDALEDERSKLKIRVAEAKIAEGALETAKSHLDGLKEALSKLDRQIEQAERRRRRGGPGGGDRSGRVGLDESAREGLQAALDSGSLDADASRRARLVLDGALLGAEQMRQLLEDAAAATEDTVDARESEVDALEREMDNLDLLILKEKARYDDLMDDIEAREEAEKDRHDAVLDDIDDRKEAEAEAWKEYQDRVADAKKAEDARHEAKMRQIEAEFRARLIAEGMIEDAGADPEELARRAEELADIIFGPLRKMVEETPTDPVSGAAGVPPGGIVPVVPVPGPPGIPVPPPVTPPPGMESVGVFGMNGEAGLPTSSSVPAGGGGGPTSRTWNQYGAVNIFDADDAPAEFLDALMGAIGMRGAR